MPFTNKNARLIGQAPTIFPAGAETVAQRDQVALVPGDLDLNDAGGVTILPAGCELVGITYDSDDLDTNGTPTIVASIGVMNVGGTALATTLATGVTASQTGTAVHLVTTQIMRLAKADVDRVIGVLFTAASATKAAGSVGLTLHYRGA